MKKIFFLVSFLISSNFAFADCYTDMRDAFDNTNQDFKDQLGDEATRAGAECMAAIEAAETGVGALLAVGIVCDKVSESDERVRDISDHYNNQYEQIHDDYCACLGGPEGC